MEIAPCVILLYRIPVKIFGNLSAEKAAEPSMTIDTSTLRRALGKFTTGVTVVTTMHQGQVSGFTANAFTSVSLDPPLVLICVGKSNTTMKNIRQSAIFAINVMTAEQETLARCFAANSPEKYERFCAATYRAEITGAPILADVAAWFDCTVHAIYEGGDHWIVVGNIEAFASQEVSPLLFAQGKYTMTIS